MEEKLAKDMSRQIIPELTLGEIVTARPELARELERHSLDYCCGGNRTLQDACLELGLDAEMLAEELNRYEQREPAEWANLGPAELVDHIEAVHHQYVKAELDRLASLLAKVLSVHGSNHSELTDLEKMWRRLRDDLEAHLRKEEEVLFPMIRQLCDLDKPVEFTCGSLENPISVMEAEHEEAGRLLVEMRRTTNDYRVPADACESYKALYSGLEDIESDLHLHIHKENNLLFPKVIELER